jgi:SlyX protein
MAVVFGLWPIVSNVRMSKNCELNAAIDERLNALEIKASFAEDLVDQLNQVIVRQQQQIDVLVQQVSQLKAQQQGSGASEFRSLRDELPPHY